MTRAKILYIDDEEINLNNFAMSFEDDFEVLTAISGSNGLELFKQHKDIAVIVADQRMPGMSGVEMLTKIYQKDPDPIRIILTGYIDPDDIILAINKGHIHQYINKPWNINKVRIILLQAVEKYNLTKENKRLIRELEDRNKALQVANQQLADDLKLQEKLERQNRESELKMMAQARLASLGQISTGIAHEINQPLTYIKISLEATARDIKNHSLDELELQRDLQESLKQINRISLIIDHLRTFGRSNCDNISKMSLPAALDSALILFKQKIKNKNMTLKIDCPPDLPMVNANICKLEQVFTNLLQNSIDALEDQEDREISVSFHQNKDQVVTKFADNGPGIALETVDKIFEPFFTTKETGKGTGLGLSIIYGIISEFKGTIECQSTPREGCAFLITLPIAGNYN